MPYADPEKQREFQRTWLADRRETWIREHGPCARCGSADQLEVDHIDPAEKLDHRLWSWSTERREAELSKCQVLCRPCHSEKCAAEGRPRTRQHGTRGSYNKGCRCALCRRANADRVARQKAGRVCQFP